MKVLHVSSSDIMGGAARAAYRLHGGLQAIGIDSNMLVQVKKSDDPLVNMCVSPKLNFIKRFLRRRRNNKIIKSFKKYEDKRPAGLELFSDSRTTFNFPILKTFDDVDIINLHWVAGFIDYQKFFYFLPAGIPVVWTLHDMNPFTGGCHYAGDCRRFEGKCGTCPQLGSCRTDDLSRDIWEDKQAAIAGLNPATLNFVSPSRWLFDQLGNSKLLGRFSKTVIPNSIDTEIFKARNTSGLREALEIPADALIIGFVADSTAKERKGFYYLKNALEQIVNSNIFLVSIGENSPKLSDSTNHIHLGSIQVDTLLSLAYSLFDIFVCPSVEDNLPNTVLESLACGTPVVGFNIGGIPDMVVSGVTGFLVSDISEESLKRCLERIISDKNSLEEMSIHCREKVLKEYSLHEQAVNYSKLYSSILSSIS